MLIVKRRFSRTLAFACSTRPLFVMNIRTAFVTPIAFPSLIHGSLSFISLMNLDLLRNRITDLANGIVYYCSYHSLSQESKRLLIRCPIMNYLKLFCVHDSLLLVLFFISDRPLRRTPCTYPFKSGPVRLSNILSSLLYTMYLFKQNLSWREPHENKYKLSRYSSNFRR